MLRGGLVGLGRMGLTHFSILQTHPGVEWVAICDSSQFVLKNLQERIRFEAFDDYEQMLDRAELDFVVVATPTRLHGSIIRKALERNLHLFVEKPLTLTGAESRELAELAEKSGVVHQVGYVNRFNEVFVEARRLLQRGLIGRPLFFRNEMHGRTVLREAAGWRSRKTEGGGCLYDFATHCVDLATFLLGAPKTVEGSVLQSIYSKDVDDAVYTTFMYEGGLTGHLTANWSDESVRKPTNRIEVLGTGGKLVAYQHELHVYLREESPPDGFRRGWNVRYVTDLARPVRFYLRGNEFTNQLDHFVESIVSGSGSDVCSFADGARTDSLLDRIASDSRSRT